MSGVERTSAGLQMIIPGCERRTLPKSTTRVDEAGQGLLHFYRQPSLRESLSAERMHLYGQAKDKRHCRVAWFVPKVPLASLKKTWRKGWVFIRNAISETGRLRREFLS